MNLYIDIETLPTQEPAFRERIAAKVTPPGTLKKPESIAAWEADQKPSAVLEAIAKTSFDGAYGHIFCIAWAFDDDQPQSFSVGADVSNEARMLAGFAAEISLDMNRVPTVVGHNVINFDIRFLWQRAIVNGVRLPSWFPRDPKPWGNDVFDTMTAFAGSRGTISMDNLSLALGLEGKGDIDGSMIADMWQRREYGAIEAYCKSDVERVRAIHRRMMEAGL